jgi:hypothetical protein
MLQNMAIYAVLSDRVMSTHTPGTLANESETETSETSAG